MVGFINGVGYEVVIEVYIFVGNLIKIWSFIYLVVVVIDCLVGVVVRYDEENVGV